MRKIWVIAEREYMAAVRTKAFLIGLLFMPIMMFGGLAAQSFLKTQVDTREKRYAVIDRTPTQALAATLEEAVRLRNATQTTDPKTHKLIRPAFKLERVAPSATSPEATHRQRFELSQRVRRGEIMGFLEIGPEVEQPLVNLAELAAGSLSMPTDDRSVVRYQTNRPIDLEFPQLAEKVVSTAVQVRRATQSGLSLPEASSVIQPVPMLAKGLSRLDERTGAISDAPDENPLTSVVVPMSLTILMLMMLMVGTSPLLQSVMEEKMQRIAEVLLGSVTPFELMMGKLAGIVGVSLTTVVVYLVGAYISAQRFGFADHLTPEVLAWFVLFQILGVVMYGSLFVAIGAACSDAKEAQSLLMPVMLVATGPVFALSQIIRDPNSTFATVLSFLPFATPMLMTARLAVPPGIPSWQAPVGALGTLLATIACVYIAGRIFRVGLLMQGKGAKLSDLIKWVLHS